jgi:hypothetical protein
LAAHLSARLKEVPGLVPQEAPEDDGSTHANYVFAIRYNADEAGLPRNLFVRAANAEFATPDSVESTALTEGYVRPLYLNKVYQQRTFMGGFPFNLQDPPRPYPQGLCPVAERMYEHELILTPLVREPLTETDMNDLADAMVKVLANKSALLDKFGSENGGIYTPVGAANSSVSAS